MEKPRGGLTRGQGMIGEEVDAGVVSLAYTRAAIRRIPFGHSERERGNRRDRLQVPGANRTNPSVAQLFQREPDS